MGPFTLWWFLDISRTVLRNPIEKPSRLQSTSCISQKSSEKTSNFCLLGFPGWEKEGKREKKKDKQISPLFWWQFEFEVRIALRGSHSLFPLRLRFSQLFMTLTCVREDWCLWNSRLPVFSAVTYASYCLSDTLLYVLLDPYWWSCALFTGLWCWWAVYSDSKDWAKRQDLCAGQGSLLQLILEWVVHALQVRLQEPSAGGAESCSWMGAQPSLVEAKFPIPGWLGNFWAWHCLPLSPLERLVVLHEITQTSTALLRNWLKM